MADVILRHNKSALQGWTGTAWKNVSVDASGYVNVNASVTSTGSDGTILDGVNATIKVTVKDYANSNPLTVVLTDTNGDAYTASGGAANQTLDYDTGAGTATQIIYGIALPASGGPVAGGTSTNPLRVDTTGTTTQPVSAASLPLPTGASTVAKQPALGTAGTASTDVITIQGIASMTKLLVTPDSVALPANQSVNVAQINGVTPLMGAGNTGTGSHRVTIATDQAVLPVGGTIAHDGADSGNPQKLGARAISYGTNPTDVSNNDRTDLFANLGGVLHVLPGHPNVITRRDNYTAAQTDTKLITVAGGTKIVILACTITVDGAVSTKPAVRAGLAQTNTPTAAGVYISHPGVIAGGGVREAGAVAGADGDDFIFTCTVPTGGSIDVVTKYFTIAS